MIAWIARIAWIAWIAHMYACMSRLGYPPIRCPSYAAAHVMLCGGSCDMDAYAYRLSDVTWMPMRMAYRLMQSASHHHVCTRACMHASRKGQAQVGSVHLAHPA